MPHKLTLRATLSRLSGGCIPAQKPDLPTKKAKRTKNALDALSKTFVKVRTSEDEHMDPKLLQYLTIAVNTGALTVNDRNEKGLSGGDGGMLPDPDGHFFSPLTKKFLNKHDLDQMSVTAASAGAKGKKSSIVDDKEKEKQKTSTKSSPSSASVALSTWHKESRAKLGYKESSRTMTLTEMFGAEFAAHLQKDNHPKWRIIFQHNMRLNTPHVKLIAYNEATGDTSQLLQTELRLILAAVSARLQLEVGNVKVKRDFKVVPVMLLSFVGPLHARVIVANFNTARRTMNIRMSELLPAGVEDKESWTFFRRYMRSDIIYR